MERHFFGQEAPGTRNPGNFEGGRAECAASGRGFGRGKTRTSEKKNPERDKKKNPEDLVGGVQHAVPRRAADHFAHSAGPGQRKTYDIYQGMCVYFDPFFFVLRIFVRVPCRVYIFTLFGKSKEYICISLFTEIFSAVKPRSRHRARSLGGVLGSPGDVLGASWARLGAVLGVLGRLGSVCGGGPLKIHC